MRYRIIKNGLYQFTVQKLDSNDEDDWEDTQMLCKSRRCYCWCRSNIEHKISAQFENYGDAVLFLKLEKILNLQKEEYKINSEKIIQIYPDPEEEKEIK